MTALHSDVTGSGIWWWLLSGARILESRSKLATARGLGGETLASTQEEVFGAGKTSADELYEAMDWLVRGRERIEKKMAKRKVMDARPVATKP